MKKRILISIVFTLFLIEVGFGVYVAFERKYESALNSLNLPIDSVREIKTDTGRQLEIATLLSEEDSFAETQVVVAQKRSHDRPIISPKSSVRKVISVSSISNRSSKSVAKAEPDKETAAMKVTESREIPAVNFVAKKETQRAEHKSLIAKTQTILKKPFGWIKSIGSKLR